ncbi:MAG: hypothetical protein QNJ65_11270 [Xenococcaceae cyanobacterium MO_234.B1]|nr:hypothetical protein [Xenococcaceae cyanobacterium MO_234.B1]
MVATNYICAHENVTAQIVSDGTLGSGGQEVGTNLFHSFKEFSPVPDTVTYLNNNPNIENIFSIDGLIRVANK